MRSAPEAPREVKALVMGSDSILVSWRPPAHRNGLITHYTVYTQAQGKEPRPSKVSPSDEDLSICSLIR